MHRAYYANTIDAFQRETDAAILGTLCRRSEFDVDRAQIHAWTVQVGILKESLLRQRGAIYLEWAIPRMGKRVDTILLIGPAIFVLEFKIGKSQFHDRDERQVMDYALDLKNFHEPSHDRYIAPLLVATEASDRRCHIHFAPYKDKVLRVLRWNRRSVASAIQQILRYVPDQRPIDVLAWESGRYSPTPTIVEAARALYRGHNVEEIARCDASGREIHRTTSAIHSIIQQARRERTKAVCFVTGVPGAGKTLIGLNLATQPASTIGGRAVLLSGNGPLVKVLSEALARDHCQQQRERGKHVTLNQARRYASSFIQNVHHFRDEYAQDSAPPDEQILIFDEAQRAWNREQTSKFMKRRRGIPDFGQSEPEFLLTCADRHPNWAVMVCLVGGGQEINTGETGIAEWLSALQKPNFRHWQVHVSDRVGDADFDMQHALAELARRPNLSVNPRLHLAVSVRSYRAERLSELVHQLLDQETNHARNTYQSFAHRYPIVITRRLDAAREWLRERARGTERYGILASSSAHRLKPLAIDVRLKPDVVHWFLADHSDVRSSFYLEDVATEFQVQGLELDWACVVWDADLRAGTGDWEHCRFRGRRWVQINDPRRQAYQKNAYRVLLTRSRQGMVICVPEGNCWDPTRKPEFYDATYEYLRGVGFPVLD